tara:strand:+ start:2306 stop:2698 length:393 start_codon:yes stop_codon:yes gene_type:complete
MKKAIVVRWSVDEELRTISPTISVTNAPMKEEDNLDFFYKSIGCRMIDVVRFDGFDAFCDDEGLLVSGNAVIEYSHADFAVPIAGNLVFSNGVDSIGRTVWFEENNPDDSVTMDIILEMIDWAIVRGVTK